MTSRSLNKVMLIGNVTKDPNVRITPTGTTVCSFGLATDRSWKSADGTENKEADFHNIVAWSKLGEICGKLIYKGTKVYVEGRIQSRDWKTQDGSEKRITEIIIDDMLVLTSPVRGGSEVQEDSVPDSQDVADSIPF